MPRVSGANETMGPLEGVKVIDMTTVLMGPYATQMLGDYGADVIKIETLDGDVTRQIGPTRHPGMGPVFLNTNRSKRSICLDLKKPKGRDAVLRLIASADVLVYNVRPQAMARLQLGYDIVSNINPRLVYAGVFGFGQDGPYAAKPAYDDLIQGATALPALMAQTSDGVPRYVPNALVDRIVGLTAVGAICASLVHRDRTGRAVNIDTVYAELARIFETRTTAEWTELLDKADVPVMPMHDLESILQDPHLVATGFFPVVDHPSEGKIRSMKTSAAWSETSVQPTRLAPRLNEHGAEILREAGFSADEIAALVRDGVTNAAP